MIQSPTCARRTGSPTPASASASRPRDGVVELPSRLPAQKRTFFRTSLLKTLFASLLKTLFDPLFGPLPYVFRQHRAHLLQPRQRPRPRTAEPSRQQHLLCPRAERRSQLLVVLLAQQSDQRAQQPRQSPTVPIRLQGDQRRHQVVPRQPGAAHAALIQQKITLRRLIPRQRLGTARGHQLRHVRRRRPWPATVVEHDRQHRRQRVVLAQHAISDQLLIQKPRIGQYPHRHRTVHAGLELQQQQIAVPLPQVVTDVAGRQRGQRAEIQSVAPVARRETVQQIPHHARSRETTVLYAGSSMTAYPNHTAQVETAASVAARSGPPSRAQELRSG